MGAYGRVITPNVNYKLFTQIIYTKGLTTMNAPMTMHERAAMLEQQHSKAELISIARNKGWKGDPERAYTKTETGDAIHQKDVDTIQQFKALRQLATGKKALAYYIAAHTGTEPAEPAPSMTAAQSTIIQQRIDQLVELGGLHQALTGDFTHDFKTLNAAIDIQMERNANRAKPAQESKPMTTTATPTDATDATGEAAQLLALISKMTAPKKQEIDREEVKQIIIGQLDAVNTALADKMTATAAELKADILAQIDTRTPRLIEVKALGDTVKLAGQQHPMFEKVLSLVNAGVNVMLTGAAGTGKTHLAESVATALNRTYGAIHCTAGASESQLMGWLLPSDGGKFEYQAAPFVDLYEQGNSVFLFDEMDAADPNFLLVANGALANGHIHIPQRRHNPSAKRGKNVGLMATTNTFGTGADMIYAGRNQLDGATLDRWYIVHIDYMTSLEASIMGATATPVKAWQPAATDDASVSADLISLHTWLNNIRASANSAKLRRVLSTRAYFKAATARKAGIPMVEIKKDLLAGWSRDELSKVGEA